MRLHLVEFHGAVLKRGFWLYVWLVRCGRKKFAYVGRTGDSSSRFAASPFSRLGAHLDLRPKAKANALLRHIRKARLDPFRCSFRMIAIGPVRPEQQTLKRHRLVRDVVAPLEKALAAHLEAKGYKVVGVHHASGEADKRLLARIRRVVNRALIRHAF